VSIAVPPPARRDDRYAPRPIPPRQRRTGLVALTAASVGLLLLAGAARGALTPAREGAAAASAVVTGYAPDPSPPAEAATKLYSSGQQGSGQYVLNTVKERSASRAAKINPFRVKVETSLHTDPDAVARQVLQVLDDPRGWASYGKNSFDLVNADAPGQLTFVLASPPTVDGLCGADKTQGKWDCRVGDTVVLNSDRWFYKTPTFESLGDYRAFMINRQVGFWLGQQTASCRHAGAYAPVMADQGKTLDGCLANPWPRDAGTKPTAAPSRAATTPAPAAPAPAATPSA